MTHADLVTRAARWLMNTKQCAVVIAEMSSGAYEEPDAIGWRGSQSYLVECKASMSDFRADALKPHRRDPERGMGQLRYYFAPPELAERIATSEERIRGWGVVSVHSRICKVLIESGRHNEFNQHGEIYMLTSAVRRLGSTTESAVSAKLYTYDTRNPRAEIHVVCDGVEA